MERIRDILFWCMLLGFGVMLMWFAMIVIAGEAIHSFHSELGTMRMMSLPLFMSSNYIGIGIWKMCVVFCFVIPWLAMKIVGVERN